MDSFQAAVDREMGVLPLSIGTALAFESLLEGNRLGDYDVVLVNIRTLIRNYYGSIKNKMAPYIDPQVAASIIIEEMNSIREQCGRVPVEFYSSNYIDLQRVLPGAEVKHPKTDKQYVAMQQEQATIMSIGEQNFLYLHSDETQFKFRHTGRALMFSHLPVDLFLRYDFSTLTLLESYTAKYKTRDEWYTKLTNGKELKRMPFNKFTLAMFGDNSVQISPQSIRLRRTLLAMSEVYGWTTITSMEKIKSDLDKWDDKEQVEILLTLARPYV